MKTLALLFALLPAAATAGELPFSGAYCAHGLTLSSRGLSMPEVGCDAPVKIATGYVAQCPTSEVGEIVFTLTKTAGGFIYSDNYWGKETLRRCPS